MRRPSLVPLIFLLLVPVSARAQALPGTKPLTEKADLARVMVEGIDRYLDRATAETAAKRRAAWRPEARAPEARAAWLQAKRDRLRHILGAIDPRVPGTGLEILSTTERGPLVAQGGGFKVYEVRWPALAGVHGEGLLLDPKGKAAARVVVLPDADQTPEQLAGLKPGLPPEAQVARVLAERGCQVLVMALINRDDTFSGSPLVKRSTNQPHREFVYRMAYEMGRHVIGYEVQKILAAVDRFSRDKNHPPVGVFGYGEGGLLALYAAALDPRIEVVAVSGSFGPREGLHAEPIYRNVWSLLKDFGDAELAALVAPRGFIVEDAPQPQVKGPPAPRPGRAGAAPGTLPARYTAKEVAAEFDRAAAHWKGQEKSPHYREPSLHQGAQLGTSLPRFLTTLLGHDVQGREVAAPVKLLRALSDSTRRQKRQFDEAVDFTQNLLGPAPQRRTAHTWSKLETSSVAKYVKSQQALRDDFHENLIGKLPTPTRPMNARTRLIYNEPKWKGYEVVLDLYDDVICYGILLVPNDIKPGERRPVVVCQHGLEGRPTDIVNPKQKTRFYNSFGAQLADRGFVVFAPQNPYIFENQFRQLVRKANPLQLSLYSFIVRQHERILDWLETLPFVDARRIAYYGLSYGGKVAMRIPAILGRYCLSICSGDFNEWVWKNITLLWGGSYMMTREYEMYEFNLGNTWNYAEMAALIAPRPFMVERGHSDGVGLDEYVAFEYAKVRRLYARLGIPERTAIEFFVGGHEIHGRGTFEFLHRHLRFPARQQ